MAIYFLDNEQQLIKIVPDNGAISILQTQELPEDSNLLKDVLSVHLKNDERLFDAQYMAIKSYDGNRNAFDMYRIVNELVPDNATEFEGVQVAPYELEGVVVEDIRPQGWTIERTTNQILKDSDWRLGYVDDDLPKVSTNFYYLSVKDSLKKLQELTGVEFTFKVEISGNKITDKWVEVYRELGNRTLKRFNYGTNALAVKRETNHSELYTALIGRGKGEEVGETDAGDATYGRKINFAEVEWKKSAGKPVDKPKGQKYIELPQATAEFGVKMLDGRKVPRIGMVEFSDTEDPEVLIEQTWQALQEYARPKVLFSATVANIGDTGIGDTVTIHRHDLNMHYKTRVRKVMRNRKNNDKTQVEIGDVVYTASTKRQVNINSQLNNMQNDLSNVKGEVSHVVTSADGKNNITYSNIEPERKKVGDSWVRDHPSLAGETQWLVWNGEAWELILDTSETTLNKEAIEQAQQEIEDNKVAIDNRLNDLDDELEGKFTGVHEEISQVDKIANQAQINASTAIDNALEAMQQASQAVDNTGSLNIRVDEVENTLSVKADKQLVDDLTGVVDLQALDIKANADGLKLKANKDTVDLIDGRVSSLGTEVSQVAGQISNKVWKTDIESAIDGIEVGGRNLLLNSEERVLSPRNAGTASDNFNFETLIYPTEENQVYTISAEVEVTDGDVNEISVYANHQNTNPSTVHVPIKDGKITRTYTAYDTIENNRVLLYAGKAGSTRGNGVIFRNIKIEKGTKATDWTPAPEDTDAKITHIETEFTQKYDSITSTVSDIDGRVTAQTQEIDRITRTIQDVTEDVEGNTTKINQTVSTVDKHTQTIATINKDLDGKVETSEYNTLVSTVDSTIRRIGDAEGNITQVEESIEGVQTIVAGKADKKVVENLEGEMIEITTAHSTAISQTQKSISNVITRVDEIDGEIVETQTRIDLIDENINLRLVKKDEIITQINLSEENILLQANKIQALGDVVVDGKLTITDEFIAPNAQIDGAKIADATIGSAKIVNLDVNKLSGNRTEFVQSAWNNAVGGNVSISGSGIVTTASNGAQGLIQNGVFLSRQPNGSTLGYIGYGQPGSDNRPFYTINLSQGAHFRTRHHLGSENYKHGLLINAGAEYAEFNIDRVHFNQQITLGNNANHAIASRDLYRLNIMGNESVGIGGNHRTVLAVSASSGVGYATFFANLNMNGYHIKNAGSYGTRSERKYKTNIIPINNALETVERMKFYEYDKNDIHELGIITDEAPECVLDKEKKTVNLYSYTSLIGKSHQELIERVKELESKVAELKGLIA